MNNLALTSYNKRFLYAAVGGPGSAHDARMLKESSFFDDVLNGDAIPDKKVVLDNFSKILLLIKCYDCNTRDNQQRYFNKNSVVLELYLRTLMGCLKVDGVFCTKKLSVGFII